MDCLIWEMRKPSQTFLLTFACSYALPQTYSYVGLQGLPHASLGLPHASYVADVFLQLEKF